MHKTDEKPTAAEFVAQLQSIQSEAEAQLRADFADAGLDYEVDYSVRTFRRMVAPYSKLLRGEYASWDTPANVADLTTFWTLRLRVIADSLLGALMVRARNEEVEAKNMFGVWKRGILQRVVLANQQKHFADARASGTMKVQYDDEDGPGARKTLHIDLDEFYDRYIKKPL